MEISSKISNHNDQISFCDINLTIHAEAYNNNA